jgi:hypothetical protein
MLRQRLTFRYVSYLLAAFLAVTAALKLHLLVTDPFADIKTGTSLPFLWLAVIVELTAVWLVFSKTPQVWKWLSLLVLFSLFALVAGTNVWQWRSHPSGSWQSISWPSARSWQHALRQGTNRSMVCRSNGTEQLPDESLALSWSA